MEEYFTEEQLNKMIEFHKEYHRPEDVIDDWSDFTDEELEEVLKIIQNSKGYLLTSKEQNIVLKEKGEGF